MSTYTKMKLSLCLAAAGLLAGAGNAQASGGPAQVDVGFHCNFNTYGCRATLGPWYAYFPYEAHFQMPAPVGLYPNWPAPFPPQPVAIPVPFPPAPIPVPQGTPPARRTAPTQSSGIQPVGYYPYGYGYGYGYNVPSYWYGR